MFVCITEILIAINWDLTKCRAQNAECRVKEDFRKRKSKLGFNGAFNSQVSVGTGGLTAVRSATALTATRGLSFTTVSPLRYLDCPLRRFIANNICKIIFFSISQ